LYTAVVFFAQYAAQFQAILDWLDAHYPEVFHRSLRSNKRAQRVLSATAGQIAQRLK